MNPTKVEHPQISFLDTPLTTTIGALAVHVNKRDRLYEFLVEKLEKFYEYLTNLASLPIDKKFHKAVSETYWWVSWCIHAWTCVKLISGSYIYHRMSGFATFLLILTVFIGFAIYSRSSKLSLAQSLSMCLMAICVSDPLLVDYSSTHRVLPFYAPPPFVIPLSISWVVQLMGPNFVHRPRNDLLGTILAPATVFYLFYGMSANSFSLSYFLWTFVLMLAAVVDFQMKIGHFREGFVPKCIVYEQFITVFWLICVNYLFIRLFSVKVKVHHQQIHIPTDLPVLHETVNDTKIL